METAFNQQNLIFLLGGVVFTFVLILMFYRPTPIIVGSRNEGDYGSSSLITRFIYLVLAAAIAYALWSVSSSSSPQPLAVPPTPPSFNDTSYNHPTSKATIVMVPDSPVTVGDTPTPLPAQTPAQVTLPLVLQVMFYQISAFKRSTGIEEERAKWQRLLPGKKVVVTQNPDAYGWYRVYVECDETEAEIYHRRYGLVKIPYTWTELAPLVSGPA